MAKTIRKPISREEAHQRCEAITQKKILSASYPGGKARESWRVTLEGGETVILSSRKSKQRAELEMTILQALGRHAVPSPRLIGRKGWPLYVQEDLSGARFSQSINAANETTATALLSAALDSLAAAQQAGSKEGLDQQVPVIGHEKAWIIELLERPIPLAEFFKEPLPDLNIDALLAVLSLKKPRFIKWDARPGNAVVHDDGRVSWFDWEHAGARNRLDDMAWLLADEFVPNFPAVEQTLIKTKLPLFADGLNNQEAETYLRVFGTFHLLIRLGLILTYKTKGKQQWWDLNYCIAQDKIGITLACAERTCLKAIRWAEFSQLTRPLIPLFNSICQKLKAL